MQNTPPTHLSYYNYAYVYAEQGIFPFSEIRFSLSEHPTLKKHKSNKLLISLVGLVLAAVPFTNAQAENINIYGWQNWSYEFVDNDVREFDRLRGNAANIGFMSHMDTGIAGLQVGLRCEQFTFWGASNEYTNWCNRNSKISLRHETAGEIMFGQWLLPYNEIVAAWIDPFYDAGDDSHTSIMGNIGGNSVTVVNPDGTVNNRGGGALSAFYYNGSFDKASDFTKAYGALAFNRRQEGIVQYVWPNTSAMADQTRDGFQFRFAVTSGNGIEAVGVDTPFNGRTVDPRIMSTGVSYQHNMGNSQMWLAAAYEQHEDVSAVNLSGSAEGDIACNDSDDEGYRLAGRYKHDWGNGQSTWIAAMYEQLEYDASCGRITALDNPATEDNEFATEDYDATDAPLWTGVERDSWMISGKHSFGNGFDVRFSYMDGDELECDANVCTAADEKNTDADAMNFGLFYTMPAGTELRATYSEVSNEANAGYDFGIAGSGVSMGNDTEMIAVGIVHWFD